MPLTSSRLPLDAYESVKSRLVLSARLLSIVSVAVGAESEVGSPAAAEAPVASPLSVPETVQPDGTEPEPSRTGSLKVTSTEVREVYFEDETDGDRPSDTVTEAGSIALDERSCTVPDPEPASDPTSVPRYLVAQHDAVGPGVCQV